VCPVLSCRVRCVLCVVCGVWCVNKANIRVSHGVCSHDSHMLVEYLCQTYIHYTIVNSACIQDKSRVDHVLEAIKEVHGWLSGGGCVKRGEKPVMKVDGGKGVDLADWATAYDLQPDKPYCERG
jgi:hypothetical protein